MDNTKAPIISKKEIEILGREFEQITRNSRLGMDIISIGDLKY